MTQKDIVPRYQVLPNASSMMSARTEFAEYGLLMFNSFGRTVARSTNPQNMVMLERRNPSSRAMLYVMAVFFWAAEPTVVAQEERGFLEAVRAGDVQAVSRLLESGVDVNARGADGATALLLAANNSEMVELLLDSGADVDLKSKTKTKKFTPLAAAVLLGNAKSVRLLIEAGADVNIKSSEGVTPLMLAAGARLYRRSWNDITGSGADHASVAHLLLAAGASVEDVADDGTTALWLAVEGGAEDIVNALLDHGADPSTPSPDGAPVLCHAVTKGRYNIVAALLRAGADANAIHDGTSALMIAATGGDTAIARLLLDKGADPN